MAPAKVSRLVRANAGANAVVDQIVSLYREIITENTKIESSLDEEARCSAAYLRWLAPTLKDQREHIQSLVTWAVERHSAVESLATQLAERHEKVLALVEHVGERQRAVDSLANELDESRDKIMALTAQVTARDAELGDIGNTLGWCLLKLYGKLKYPYLLPLYRLLRLAPHKNER